MSLSGKPTKLVPPPVSSSDSMTEGGSGLGGGDLGVAGVSSVGSLSLGAAGSIGVAMGRGVSGTVSGSFGELVSSDTTSGSSGTTSGSSDATSGSSVVTSGSSNVTGGSSNTTGGCGCSGMQIINKSSSVNLLPLN